MASTPQNKRIDLGREVTKETGYSPEDHQLEYREFDVFGDGPFRALYNPNAFALAQFVSDDTADLIKAFTDLIHPEDRRAFKNCIARLPGGEDGFDAEKLGSLIKQLLELVTGGKESSSASSASGSSTRKKAAVKRLPGG